MAEVWDEVRVQQYIDDGKEESLNLDYKAAGALAKSDGKKREITKAVSAMANSDGGTIIYGVLENQNIKYLPGEIDPISRREFPKEWLDNVISSIRPNIDGLVIHPVVIGEPDSNLVVYVVDIPISLTAPHQATDKRYYKRVNIKSRPMEDSEIRDVMNRQQHPRIELEFEITRGRFISSDMGVEHETDPQFRLAVYATNSGKVYARHTDIQIEIPPELQHFNAYSIWDEPKTVDDPMFPGCRYRIRDVALRKDFDNVALEDLYLSWTISADSAPKSAGKMAFSAIKVTERTVHYREQEMEID